MAPYKQIASGHPDGIVDLSVGTPVDSTPEVITQALAAAADAPGYPTVHGQPGLRDAICGWLDRRLAVAMDPADVLPLIGSKEFVAWLPTMLGLNAQSVVASPEIAYPTYVVGALIAGCRRGAPEDADLIWVNSPSNPTGAVASAEELTDVVRRARERGAVVVSDECYIELGWDAEPVSILHPAVCGGDHTGLLSVHSLSKRSNAAGLRSGFVAGDPSLVAQLIAFRKHAGMMVPSPVQAASTVAWGDDRHVQQQRGRYAGRRDRLISAMRRAGLRVDHSRAGLYLWVSRGEPCWETVQWFAARGISVAPGDFYGEGGSRHVRVALTATDERIDSAVSRL